MSNSRNLADLLDANGDVSLGDNVKAKFGASDDLQIYHDGSHSYIDDAGTGELLIRGSAVTRIQSYIGEDMIVGVTNGAANLYHNGTKKLATTSTGIDVTGSVSTPEIYQNFSQGCISRKISTRVNQGNVWRKILRIDFASVASWGAAIVTIRTMSSYSTDVIQATYRLTSHAAAGSLTSSLQTGYTGNTGHIRFIKFATNQYDLELYSATSENAAADITFQTVSRNNQPIVTTMLN